MAGELTVSERILYHLNSYVKFEDKYEVPFDVTQDGISQACLISRAHAAIELKKLKASGVILEKLSHVRRGKARRKVYFLTHEGKTKAAKVIQYTRDSQVNPMVDSSRISHERMTSNARALKKSSAFPTVKIFYGRDREIELLKTSLSNPSTKVVCVKGIAGIGKTSLVARVCSNTSDCRIFWHTSRSWDAPRNLEEALSRFFADNGSRKLASYLASGKTELGELSFLLNEELGENGYMFVFDDADHSDYLQEFLKMLKHSSGTAKIIVTAESTPRFYEQSDVVARQEVVEIELGGLDRPTALKLLKNRGIEGDIAEELVRVTNGHPLSLEMVTASTSTEARYQVSRFLEEKFYSVLTENERSLLQFASVFQKPFPADAIPRELKQARRGSMLREIGPGTYEIHATLRDFVYSSLTKEERARWHSAAADFYLRSGDLQERLAHLVNANRNLEAEILSARHGEELLGNGNIQRLWEVLSRLEPSKPKYVDSVRLLKARVATLVGEYDSAWSILDGISRSDDPRLGADALVEMGGIKSKKGELEEALRLFSEALEKAKNLPCERAKALRGLGVVKGKLGLYEEAQGLLERSALDSLAAMDQKGLLLAHMELGGMFIAWKKYGEAIEHFSKCAAAFGPVELTNVYFNLGVANAFLGKPDEARPHLENAVRLADETGQSRLKALALNSLAEVLLKTGEIEQAKESSFAALDIVTDIDDKLAISAAYANLGMAERNAGNFSASEDNFAESLRALEDVDAPEILGVRKFEFGMMLAQKGEVERAAALLEESLGLLRKADAQDMMVIAETELKKLA